MLYGRLNACICRTAGFQHWQCRYGGLQVWESPVRSVRNLSEHGSITIYMSVSKRVTPTASHNPGPTTDWSCCWQSCIFSEGMLWELWLLCFTLGTYKCLLNGLGLWPLKPQYSIIKTRIIQPTGWNPLKCPFISKKITLLFSPLFKNGTGWKPGIYRIVLTPGMCVLLHVCATVFYACILYSFPVQQRTSLAPLLQLQQFNSNLTSDTQVSWELPSGSCGIYICMDVLAWFGSDTRVCSKALC